MYKIILKIKQQNNNKIRRAGGGQKKYSGERPVYTEL